MASDLIPFSTTSFRQFYSELDDWRHYLASIRDRLPARRPAPGRRQAEPPGQDPQDPDRALPGDPRSGLSAPARRRERGPSEPEERARRRASTRGPGGERRPGLLASGVGPDRGISRAAVGFDSPNARTGGVRRGSRGAPCRGHGILGAHRTPNGQPSSTGKPRRRRSRGSHKGGVRFNPDDFDLDLFVVDATWYAAIVAEQGPASSPSSTPGRSAASRAGVQARALQKSVVAALEAPGAIPGLRGGRKLHPHSQGTAAVNVRRNGITSSCRSRTREPPRRRTRTGRRPRRPAQGVRGARVAGRLRRRTGGPEPLASDQRRCDGGRAARIALLGQPGEPLTRTRRGSTRPVHRRAPERAHRTRVDERSVVR